jgi:uncharacterized protein DUF5916
MPIRRCALLLLSLAMAGRAQAGQSAAAENTGAPQPAVAAPAGLVETARLRLPRVTRAPQLKDFLSGTPREAEAAIAGFRQNEPGDGTPVSQSTTAYLSYDDRNLYVVFVCEDSGGARGHMAKREELNDDDLVGVYLDTFNDRRHAYAFEANPLGLQRDGLMNEGQKTDYTFDTVWDTDGRLTDKGFVVWMAIPFKSLRFAGGDTQTWGIALRRKILTANEDAYWPYVTRRVAGFVNQMARLEDMDGVSASHNIRVIPYGTFTGARVFDTSDASFRTTADLNGGVDAKFVIRDALTLDVTARPDFSQVESDEPQVIANQRYEVQFAEKRPFFMENAGFFQTPIQLFYSRRIIEPQLGAKLTGKVNQWAVGAFVMDDRAPGAVLSPDEPGYGNRTGAGLFRLQREFGSQSSAGVLVTTRDFNGRSNRVVGFDTRLKLSPNWYFTGQVAGSDTREEGGQSSGEASLAQIDYAGRHFLHSTSYYDFSPSFDTDLGYVKRVDVRGANDYASYTWYPRSTRLVSFGPSVSVSGDWDHRQVLQDWNVYPTFALNFPRQTQIKVGTSETYELYQGIGFRSRVSEISGYSAPSKSVGFSAALGVGQEINYAPAAGLVPFLGDLTQVTLASTWRPARRLRIDGFYLFERLAQPVTRPDAGGQRSIFDNQLARLKVNYQFTRALSLRAILDYYALLPDESQIDYTTSRIFTGDVLMTYLIRPGTALYIGYTNRMENAAIDPAALARLRLTGSTGTVSDRQFFTKVSYLLRF